MFESFGISGLAEAAYRVLLLDPGIGPKTLGLTLDVEPEEVAGALTELARHGLISGQQFGPIAVTPPERAVELLIAREEARLEERRRTWGALRDGVGGLVAEFVAGRRRASGTIEEVRGAAAVRTRLHQAVGEARHDVWSVDPGPAGRRWDELRWRHGVPGRAIHPAEVTRDGAMLGYLGDAVAAGDDVRLHADPRVRLTLVDGELAVLPSGAGAYVVHGADLVHPFRELFELLWVAARPFDPRRDAAVDADEARLRQVIGLLAKGMKDETIARRLGVSVRTTRRLIALATEWLGAESRFQAGILAAQRGLV